MGARKKGKHVPTADEAQTVATDPVTGHRMLTRGQVAKSLGVSLSLVRKMEREKRLPCYVTPDGIHTFSPRDVEELRVSRLQKMGVTNVGAAGDLAADVFALLERDQTPIQIVTSLRIHPNVVEQLTEQHARMSGAVSLSSAHVRELRELLPAGDGDRRYGALTADHVVDMAKRAVAAAHLCTVCGDATARFCAACTPSANDLRAAARKQERAAARRS